MSTGYVYYLHDPKAGIVKIGHSARPEDRKKDLERGRSPLVLLARFPGNLADERAHHRMWSRLRVYGEWFTATDALLAHAESIGITEKTGEYILWLYVERPDKRKRDIFNLPKAIEDLLVEMKLVEDDSLCVEGHVIWAGEGRRCTVMVEPAKPIAMAVAA